MKLPRTSLAYVEGFTDLNLYLDDSRHGTNLTVLQTLAEKEKHELMKLAVAAGADIHAHAEGTLTPLRCAIDKGHHLAASILLGVYQGRGRLAQAYNDTAWSINGQKMPLLSSWLRRPWPPRISCYSCHV